MSDELEPENDGPDAEEPGGDSTPAQSHASGGTEVVEDDQVFLPPWPEPAPQPEPPTLAPELVDLLDPSMVQLPLFWTQHEGVHEPLFLWHYRGKPQASKRAFWGGRDRWHRETRVRGDFLPQNPFVHTLGDLPRVDRDYMLLSDERIDELQSLQSVNIETKRVIVPWSVNEQMEEKVPQFTLRNIARLEKDDSVERGIRLDYEPAPFAGAAEELDEVRNFRHDAPEMPRSWSAPLFEDFAIFIHEVLDLCPWDAMPTERKLPPEDSPWHPQYSRAQLTRDLLERRGTIMVFGQRGGPKTLLKERQERVYEAADKSSAPSSSVPDTPPPPPGGDRNPQGGFGFGPDSGPMG